MQTIVNGITEEQQKTLVFLIVKEKQVEEFYKSFVDCESFSAVQASVDHDEAVVALYRYIDGLVIK